MKSNHKTFTLIELILVVAIVAILAGVMIPAITSARQKARAAKVLQLIDTLRDACALYHSDTGEYGGANLSFPGPIDEFSNDSGVPGWDGPYTSQPLSAEDNPFGDSIWITNVMSTTFDLDGDGSIDKMVWTRGNSMAFSSVPQAAAQSIDNSMDKGIPGDWTRTGRVAYFGTVLVIYLAGGSP